MHTKLFHGTANPAPFDELRVQDYEQEKNGSHGRWLFATHRWDQALVYALPRVAGILTTMTHEPDESGPLALFQQMTSPAFSAQAVNGRVYSFSSNQFNRVAKAPREWVRDSPLQLTPDNHQQFIVNSAAQVMAEGVQIFTLRHTDDAFIMDPKHIFKGPCMYTALAEILTRPNSPLIWENQKAGVGINQELVAQIKRAARPPSCT